MEGLELNQIVVQVKSSEVVRALAQYEGDFPPPQKDIIYDELSAADKKIWDNFVAMIKTK